MFQTKKSDISPDYKVEEVARLLSASKPTIYKLINTGKLHFYKVGRGTRITRESVEALRARRVDQW